MIIGKDAVKFVSQLNAELTRKTLAHASGKLNLSFPRLVPWMCLACLTDIDWIDTSILFDEYEWGELLTDREKLHRIAEFLRKEGSPIMDAAIGPNAGLLNPITFSVIEEVRINNQDGIACYHHARNLLLESDPLLSYLFKSLVHFVIPIRSSSGKFSFSTHLARGAIFLSLSEKQHSKITMTIDLAHELGHQALMIFQSADPLLESPLDQPLWSGIRQTYRPAIQCLQATAALSYMTLLTGSLRRKAELTASERDHIEENHDSQLEKMKSTLYGLKRECRFTEAGKRIIKEFESLAEGRT